MISWSPNMLWRGCVECWELFVPIAGIAWSRNGAEAPLHKELTAVSSRGRQVGIKTWVFQVRARTGVGGQTRLDLGADFDRIRGLCVLSAERAMILHSRRQGDRSIYQGIKRVAAGSVVTRRTAAIVMFVPYLPGGRKFSITQSSFVPGSKELKASRFPSG